VGPRLRLLLRVLWAMLAVLGANSLYLAGITVVEAVSGEVHENYFYQQMFLVHLVLGFALILPLLTFAGFHLANARTSGNRRATTVGYFLLATVIALLTSGVLLTRIGPWDLRLPWARWVAYSVHVASPLAAGWLYWLHRLAGRRIRWRAGMLYGAVAVAFCLGMAGMHGADPRRWSAKSPSEGERYFRPSLARTATGELIPARALIDGDYCKTCHADVHADWEQSAHRFSSFNNPVYLAAVRETREFSKRRRGDVARARWCAGCHDPVPFFSGAFDDPNFDDVGDPTAQAGITCTACHAITSVNSTRGNADYTIEEPLHYPFAYSENPLLRWVNRQLILAKPSFHKKTFLKPFHRTAEFCSTCHKVHLPEELNDYKFLRGQNHYDTYLLSGVSGHGARSFYYPPEAKTNCAACHMPLKPSGDFGAKHFDDSGQLTVHSHFFPGANTGIAWLGGRDEAVLAHQNFLRGAMRVDLFGLHRGSGVDSPLAAPLRPRVPALKPGEKYVLDVVVRTLALGHPFTQGTADSNEVWLEVTASSNGVVLARSGAIDSEGRVDPWSHFVNVFMLDREGNRIARRNAQDIFVPLYDNQIPPGAAQTVHYALETPKDLAAPLTVSVRLLYRKFDAELMEFVSGSSRPGDAPLRGSSPGRPYRNQLPVTMLAHDQVTFPIESEGAAPPRAVLVPPAAAGGDSALPPEWERWNDYGIGLFLKGRAELRQAAAAFGEVEKLGRYDGPLNLARVYFAEGRLDEAAEAIRRAKGYADPAPPHWTVAWLTGLVNRQQGHLAEAERNFRDVLESRTPEMISRRFDFGREYEVINLLGETLFDQAKQRRAAEQGEERAALLRQAVEQFEKTLALDPENVAAHHNLALLYSQLGDSDRAERHRRLHARYKPDDNARDRAVAAARRKYPAADRAAERTVIYPLRPPGEDQAASSPRGP